MFGYVKPFVPRMMVCEHEEYKAVYCGVCKALGKLCGPLMRLTLSYDFVFLALFGMAQKGEAVETESFRCALNPLKKRKLCVNREILSKTAACAVILMYFKLKDDAQDKKGIKRLFSHFKMIFLYKGLKESRNLYADIYEAAELCIKKQREVEKDGVRNIDLWADPTAQTLGLIMASYAKTENAEAVRDFGYMLGRWVYLADAADDLKNDEKKKNYNPFLNIPDSKERIERVLNLTVTETDARYERAASQYHHGIIDNIIRLGLPAVQREILKKL